jgi:hypothetical protein
MEKKPEQPKGKFKPFKPVTGMKKPKGFKNPKQTMQGFKGLAQGQHGKEAGKKLPPPPKKKDK